MKNLENQRSKHRRGGDQKVKSKCEERLLKCEDCMKLRHHSTPIYVCVLHHFREYTVILNQDHIRESSLIDQLLESSILRVHLLACCQSLMDLWYMVAYLMVR